MKYCDWGMGPEDAVGPLEGHGPFHQHPVVARPTGPVVALEDGGTQETGSRVAVGHGVSVGQDDARRLDLAQLSRCPDLKVGVEVVLDDLFSEVLKLLVVEEVREPVEDPCGHQCPHHGALFVAVLSARRGVLVHDFAGDHIVAVPLADEVEPLPHHGLVDGFGLQDGVPSVIVGKRAVGAALAEVRHLVDLDDQVVFVGEQIALRAELLVELLAQRLGAVVELGLQRRVVFEALAVVLDGEAVDLRLEHLVLKHPLHAKVGKAAGVGDHHDMQTVGGLLVFADGGRSGLELAGDRGVGGIGTMMGGSAAVFSVHNGDDGCVFVGEGGGPLQCSCSIDTAAADGPPVAQQVFPAGLVDGELRLAHGLVGTVFGLRRRLDGLRSNHAGRGQRLGGSGGLTTLAGEHGNDDSTMGRRMAVRWDMALSA